MQKDKFKVLALITARGGSKGLPRKNVLRVAGKPLIAWTIEAALKSNIIDQVVLSSDDDEIIEISKEWGCSVPFQRPGYLASDTASSIDVVLHALDQLPGFEYVVLLQPTSPLRTAANIDEAFALLMAKGAPSCVSVCESNQSPYWMFRLKEDNSMSPLLPNAFRNLRRQDLPVSYVLNGAIYIAQIDWLRKTKNFIGEGSVAYRMSKEQSIDIDNYEDFDSFRLKIKEK